MFSKNILSILSLSTMLTLSACGQVQRFPYVPSGSAKSAGLSQKGAMPTTATPPPFVNAPTADAVTTDTANSLTDKTADMPTAHETKPEFPSPLVIVVEQDKKILPLKTETNSNINCGALADNTNGCPGDQVLFFDKATDKKIVQTPDQNFDPTSNSATPLEGRIFIGMINKIDKNQATLKIDRAHPLMTTAPETATVAAAKTHVLLISGYKNFRKGHVVAFSIAKGQRVAGEIDQIYSSGLATVKVDPLVGVGSKLPRLYVADLNRAAKQVDSFNEFKVDDRIDYRWGDRFFGLDKSKETEIIGRIAEIFENGQMIIEVDPTLLNGSQVYRLFWIDPGQISKTTKTFKGFSIGDDVSYTFKNVQKYKIDGKVTELFENGRAIIEVDQTRDDGNKVFHTFGADIKSLAHSK